MGNSSTVCGIWSEGAFAFRSRVPTAELATASLLAPAGAGLRPSTVAVASVVPGAEPALEGLLDRELSLRPVYLGRDLAVPLELDLEEPGAAGADRTAAALAACRRFGDAVVVDFGTAITVDAVTAGGRFLGGAILPGPEACLRALEAGTSGVRVSPPVETCVPPGRSTREAVCAALTHGLAGAVDRLVEETRVALGGRGTAAATGGAAALLVPLCRSDFEVVPDLVLEGLVLAATDGG
jgi:type III pantothenate kinase